MGPGLKPGEKPKSPDGGGLIKTTGIKGGLVRAAAKNGGLVIQPTKSPSDSAVLTVIVEGQKDVGKSAFPAGYTPKKGGRKVIIACDDTTSESLMNRYGAEFFEQCELYEITRRNHDSGYPGYDPNSPATGELVLGNLMLLLDQLEQDGDVEMLYVDHFQALYEQVAVSYARHLAGLGPDDRMQLEHWAPRTSVMGMVESKIRRIPQPGGIVFISGYGAEEKNTYDVQVDATGREKRVVVRKFVDPKWLKDDIKRNWLVHLRLDRTRDDEGNDSYTCEVISSKTPRFPKGTTVDVTNSDVNMFLESKHFPNLSVEAE